MGDKGAGGHMLTLCNARSADGGTSGAFVTRAFSREQLIARKAAFQCIGRRLLPDQPRNRRPNDLTGPL
jgi:hypothetical protein